MPKSIPSAVPEESREEPDYASRYLAPLLLSLLTLRVIGAALCAGFMIPSKLDLSFPEGAVVARAYDVLLGETPYHDWRQWPHSFSPYGPLTYFPVGWIGKLISPTLHPLSLYLIGRLQSALALTGIGILIFSILGRLGAPPLWRWAGVAAFVSWDHPFFFVTSYRPDAPQVFFSLLALRAALGGEARRGRVLAALFFLSISMWIKPTSWGVAAALAFWIAASRNLRAAILAMGVFGVANLALACLLNWKWDGALFLNMIGSLDNGWRLANLPAFYRATAFIPIAMLLAGAGFAALELRRKNLPREARIFLIAALATYAAATLQNLKVGADANYYLESYALIAPCALLLIRKIWNGEMNWNPRFRSALVWGVIAPMVLFNAGEGLRSLYPSLRSLHRGWEPVAIARYAAGVEGPILIKNPFLALQRPTPETILDFVQYSILVKRGKLDDRGLVERLRSGSFSAVIATAADIEDEEAEWFSPASRRMMMERYEITARLGAFAIMTPRKSQ